MDPAKDEPFLRRTLALACSVAILLSSCADRTSPAVPRSEGSLTSSGDNKREEGAAARTGKKCRAANRGTETAAQQSGADNWTCSRRAARQSRRWRAGLLEVRTDALFTVWALRRCHPARALASLSQGDRWSSRKRLRRCHRSRCQSFSRNRQPASHDGGKRDRRRPAHSRDHRGSGANRAIGVSSSESYRHAVRPT